MTEISRYRFNNKNMIEVSGNFFLIKIKFNLINKIYFSIETLCFDDGSNDFFRNNFVAFNPYG